MKFIADFTEREQYRAMTTAVESIKKLLTLKEIEEIKARVPQGDFENEEQKLEAYGEQGYQNMLEIITQLMETHEDLLIEVNHAFWKPEIVKKPVKEEKWDDNGFLVTDWKRDELGHVIYEDYQETEEDYPLITKTIGKILTSNESWLPDFFTFLRNLKSLT